MGSPGWLLEWTVINRDRNTAGGETWKECSKKCKQFKTKYDGNCSIKDVLRIAYKARTWRERRKVVGQLAVSLVHLIQTLASLMSHLNMKSVFYKEAREDTVVKSKTWLSYKRDNRLNSTL